MSPPTPRRTRPPAPGPLLAGLLLVGLVGLLALVGLVGLVGSAGPAGAAPRAGGSACPAVDVTASTKAAMAVFEGTVDAAPTAGPKPDGSRGSVYDQTVTVQVVFQGRIRTDTVTVQTERTPKQCSLGPLDAGQSYLFFVQGDGDPWVAVSGAGTAKATTDLVSQVQAILGQGRPPVQPSPESAEFTPLHPAAPQSLARVAAPGVALVLVGLLGLALLGGRQRRLG